MKLLLDQGAPRSVGRLLREAGFDAQHTAEIGFSEAADEEILKKALSEGRTVVTLDADFHALLAHMKTNHPSVIRIRIELLRAEELASLVQKVLKECGTDLERGAVVSVQPGRIRVRSLPIG